MVKIKGLMYRVEVHQFLVMMRHRVHTVTIASDGGITYLTGSLSNPSGFMVKTAGQGVLTATDGGDIPAGDVTADEIYPIGVKEISGSCKVHVVY